MSIREYIIHCEQNESNSSWRYTFKLTDGHVISSEECRHIFPASNILGDDFAGLTFVFHNGNTKRFAKSQIEEITSVEHDELVDTVN